MNAQQALAKLDELIERRSILRHPFYVAWQEGQLSREQLATYAAVYYPHVAAFPHYLRTAAAATSDPLVRQELERNLADELGVPKAHDALWLDFAEGVGVDREDVVDRPPHRKAEEIVNTFSELSTRSAAHGLAALYAYESQQPEVAGQKAAGLRQLYGVDDATTVAYFDVHAETDIEHRAGERQALESCLECGSATAEELLEAADLALDAYWGLLDGICEDAGIPVACSGS